MTQIGPGLRHNGENTILGLSEKDTKVQRTNQNIQKGKIFVEKLFVFGREGTALD